jgi:hypothetical protein
VKTIPDWREIREAAEGFSGERSAHPDGSVMDAGDALAMMAARDRFTATVSPEIVLTLLALHESPPVQIVVGQLNPWLAHTADRYGRPCITGTRADDGDAPSTCICGLNDRLREIGAA